MSTTPLDANQHTTGDHGYRRGWRDPARTRPSVAVPAPSHGQRNLLIVLWVVGAILLAIMSVAAHAYPEFPGDVGLTQMIQQLHQPQIAGFINTTSTLNWPKPAGIIAIGAILYLLLIAHFRAAIGAAISSFGADFVNVTLNSAVARPRPHGVQIQVVAHLGLHSYPSGHVTHVIAFYGFLLYLSTQTLRHQGEWHRWLHAVQIVCLYFIIFIGPSRVLQGEHWPSDVVASYLLGSLMLLIGIGVYHLLPRQVRREHERSHPIQLNPDRFSGNASKGSGDRQIGG